MRYLTREWYEGMQTSPICEVRANQRAAQYSEEYFQSLYDRKQREWLELQWKLSEEGYREALLAKFDKSPEEFECWDAYEQTREEYLQERIKTLWNVQLKPFDEEAERAEFARRYQCGLDAILEEYPKEILDSVADLRVLALGVAAPEVKERIDSYKREVEQRKMAPLRSYARHHKALLRKYSNSFVERFDFHDYSVERVERREEELILDLTSGYSDAEQSRVRFIDCEVLRMDEGLLGVDWLYEEVYEGKPGWEIHVLFFNCDRCDSDPLRELILRASDVIVE